MTAAIPEQQLRAFLAVVECGSFTRAAETLAYSQPAISLHVKALESMLGQRLFERCGHRVRLTCFGEQLYAVAVEIVSGLEALRAQLWAAVAELSPAADPAVSPYPATVTVNLS
jgi:DNA-binding transcriptional LysR family regulator